MVKISPSILQGEISPPPSKSITHRALILAAAAEKGTIITNLLRSADTNATKDGLERMGAVFDDIENGIKTVNTIMRGTPVINCENSGTTMRLLTGIAALFEEETMLYGDESLNKRPMRDLIYALEELGVDIEHNNGYPPITIKSPVKDYSLECKIPGEISSQFISSLLIMSAFRGEDYESTINLIPPVVSRPYLKLTEEILRFVGIDINYMDNAYHVTGTTLLPKFQLEIPSDYSSAAFFLVAGALPGNKITVKNINNQFTQADANIIQYLEKAGASIIITEDQIVVEHEELKGFDADLSDSPDLFPILSVLASYCDGKSTLFGAEHLKYKETNRIESMVKNLRKMGIEIKPLEDGAIIVGGTPNGGLTLESYGDHRIAMACAILASQAKKSVDINNFGCVSVSYPNFMNDYKKLKINI